MRTKVLMLLGILMSGFRAVAQQPESTADSLKQDSIGRFLNTIYYKMSSDSLLHQGPTENVFIHIKPPKLNESHGDTAPEFMLYYQSPDLNWMSSSVKILDRDSTGFLVTLRVPSKVLATAPMLSCIAMWSWGTYNLYGGVDMKVIKLMLDSKPSNAKVYLVPNRIWMSTYEKDEQWKKGISYEYLVDSSTTDTSVNIDQTVYTVVFNLGDKFIIRKHKTESFNQAPVQHCSATF